MNKKNLGICKNCKHLEIINVSEGQSIDSDNYGFIIASKGMQVSYTNGECKLVVTGECIVCKECGKGIMRVMTNKAMTHCGAYEEKENV